ncbi:MAG: DUF1254 domain-containing protein [Bacteroidetes bacterium]|nr:DUF1254 domain-containing protein [Bacteroidota bacterium]
MKKLFFAVFIITGLSIASCSQKQAKVSPEEAKQIAEEAYIYAYPMLDHYKMMFAMAMYPESGAYTAPINEMYHNPALSGPKDTIIVRPNNDTFYSSVWFDLSGQPQILKVPAITDGRCYSFQIIDMYTHNVDYVGTRKTGFDSGTYMFAGPDWDGEKPEGINKVIQSEGNYLLALGRTQVFGPDDIESVQAVMNNFEVLTLGEYLGKDVQHVASLLLDLPPYNPAKVSDENFIGYFNALMAHAKIHPTEKELFAQFAKIGIEPGKPFNPEDYDPEVISAINKGIQAGMEKIKEASMKLGVRKNGWQLIANAFGTRDAMQGKYLTRAAAAYFGLWGNDLEEAFYPETTFDADGEELDGSKHNYLLHFEADQLPPAKAFWSMTMYKLPAQLLIENEINRYVIGSATEGLKYNDDGSLDIYILKGNPGTDKVSNWLPAYDGPFSLQARFYWPDLQALDPLYAPPAVQKNDK